MRNAQADQVLYCILTWGVNVAVSAGVTILKQSRRDRQTDPVTVW